MNIRDAESAYQIGRIRWLEFQQDFERVWNAPLYRAQMGAFMATMTPQDMMTPGMEGVAPVVNEMLGGNDASTSNPTRMEVPWTGSPNPNQNGNGPPPTLPGY